MARYLLYVKGVLLWSLRFKNKDINKFNKRLKKLAEDFYYEKHMWSSKMKLLIVMYKGEKPPTTTIQFPSPTNIVVTLTRDFVDYYGFKFLAKETLLTIPLLNDMYSYHYKFKDMSKTVLREYAYLHKYDINARTKKKLLKKLLENERSMIVCVNDPFFDVD